MARPRWVLSSVCLLLAGLGSANAQSFTFSSCGGGVTFRGNISELMPLPGNPKPDGHGGRQYNYTFSGAFSLTVGRSTQVSSGFSTLAIGYLVQDISLGGPRTTLLIEAPNAAGNGGPGMGAAAARLEWGVGLQGAGDLMPNGFTGTFRTSSTLSVIAACFGPIRRTG